MRSAWAWGRGAGSELPASSPVGGGQPPTGLGPTPEGLSGWPLGGVLEASLTAGACHHPSNQTGQRMSIPVQKALPLWVGRSVTRHGWRRCPAPAWVLAWLSGQRGGRLLSKVGAPVPYGPVGAMGGPTAGYGEPVAGCDSATEQPGVTVHVCTPAYALLIWPVPAVVQQLHRAWCNLHPCAPRHGERLRLRLWVWLVWSDQGKEARVGVSAGRVYKSGCEVRW